MITITVKIEKSEDGVKLTVVANNENMSEFEKAITHTITTSIVMRQPS